MAKINTGDIFEIDTNKGKGYFQCVKIDKLRCDTIKVFNQLYDKRPSSIGNITNVNDTYFIGFPLSVALHRKLVSKVGYIPLADDFELPKYTRDMHKIMGQFLGWHIVDNTTLKRQFVEKLSAEQKHLSPSGVINDTLLKEQLEAGWSLENWS